MKKRALIIAPHPDDETLGMGGTIAKMISEDTEVFILTVAGHLPPLYKEGEYELTVQEAQKAYEILGVKNSKFLEIPSSMVRDEPVHILNGKISSIITEFEPHYVFCPFPDRHIDHRVVFESTLVATRPVRKAGKNIELVAAYETLSETHWNAPYIEPNFNQNFVVDITEYIDQKIDALRCYKSQISEDQGPRSIKATKALATFRGTQSGFNYGEALYVIRMVG
ncbi:MAG: PIG-L domain-containing protein [Acidiferrobacteraceae bacterium]|nr:PIG-L domain-containing protein [Acidiferrobacteraceae bacterium]